MFPVISLQQVKLMGRLCLLVICFLTGIMSYAQDTTSVLMPDSLKKQPESNVLFGFNIGFVSPILKSPQLDIYHFEANDGLPDTITNMSVAGITGLHVGLLLDVKLHKNLWIKTNPAVNVASGIMYRFTDPEATKMRYRKTTFVDLPLSLAYHFPAKKLVPVISAGMSYRIVMQELKGSSYSSFIAAFSIERKFKKFIFAPEIRYGLSLKAIELSRSPQSELPLVDKMKINTICFALNFKG